MFNSNLKYNIKHTTAGHARQFWAYHKKISEYFYIYLIALSHQTKYNSKQSSGQRNTKL